MSRSLLACVVVCVCAGRVLDAAANPDEAARYFADAQDDFAAGRYDASCKKLEISVRMRMQIRPLGLLAACYEKLGRLATAWRMFKDVRVRAEAMNDPDIANAAAGHVDDLEPRLARLIIKVPSELQVAGCVIALDGKELTQSELDKPLEIDAGVHVLAVSTRDGKNSQEITIRDGEIKSAPFPKLELTNAEATQPAPPPATLTKSKRKIAGVATLGTGVVVLGVGAFLGLSARSRWGDAKAAGCTESGRCPTQAGVDLVNAANGKATASTILIAAGTVVAATGAILWLTAPKQRAERSVSVTPLVADTSAGLVVRGWF